MSRITNNMSVFGSSGNNSVTTMWGSSEGTTFRRSIVGQNVTNCSVVNNGASITTTTQKRRKVVHIEKDGDELPSSSSDIVELHIHQQDFDWKSLKNHSIVNVVVHGNVKGDVTTTNLDIKNGNLSGDILNSVNVMLTNGQVKGNVKAVNFQSN